MSKQIINQRLIYKIHSSRFRINNWDLSLTLQEAKDNEEVVALGDSITLRMIRKIKGDITTEEDIFNIKKKINKLKKQKTKDNSKEIDELYDLLDSKILIEEYLAIVFDNIADWDRFNKKNEPVLFNNKSYKRLVGTNGGVKNNTVIFCRQDIYDKLNEKLNNGRNKKKQYVPAKFESYKALACSASTPVTQPKGVLVIKDGERQIIEKVLQLTDDGKGGFKLIPKDKYEINRAFTDGCGMICKALADQWAIDLGEYKEDENNKKIAKYTPSGFNIRNSWTKGMVFCFPYLEFAEKVAKEFMVEDAWGNMIDIRNVELIITTNMLKLWDAYESIDDYLNNCKENGFEYCVTKMLPQELETVRNMNYQFLQSYEFSDEDIQKLIKPTVDSILGAIGGDYGKTLLFLKGNKITENDFLHEEFDFVKALMINENLRQDPFIKQKIHRMIKKRISDSKKGVIQVEGNYSVISGDLYALCQYMFGEKVTGLLKKDEYYSRTWLDKNVDKVVAYRAPMTNHNNIKIFRLKDNDEIKKWYRYMTTCTILNSFDCTVDALNGADFDGDAVITTNNDVLLRNTKELLPIICEQKSIPKRKITEKALRCANKNGFGNDVGSVTNKCTGMFDVLAKFNKDSNEYKILNERIICMQGYQQEVIDSVKGCIAKQVPKHWYDYKELKIKKEDSEELTKWKEKQLELASLKKPYFFIYNYKHLMNRYKKYIKDSQINSIIRFGVPLDELIKKDNKSKEEQDFVEYYNLLMPVSTNNSTMNRICWALEESFKDVKLFVKKDNFDTNILKSEYTFAQSKYKEIEKIYNEYKDNVKQYMIVASDDDGKEKKEKRQTFINNFKKQVYSVCGNKYVLCNILIDMCYSNKESKQFVWDMCGKTIIETLLKKHNNIINYPVIIDKNEDFIWNNNKYKMIQKEVNKEDNFIC